MRRNDPGAEQRPSVGSGLVQGAENGLAGMIWPTSFSLWMAAFYLALVIIRPWERLFPWLDDLFPFQKSVAIFVLMVILFSARARITITFQSITVLMFAASLGLSSLLARDPSLAWEPFYDYLTVIFIYFVLTAVIRNPYDLVFMGLSYIGIMAAYLGKSLWEFFLHGNLRYTMGVVRLVGIEHLYGSPNGVAASVVHSLPILFVLWMTRKDYARGWPDSYRALLPIFLLGYLCLSITSIILTNSRAGFVCLLMFLLLLFFRMESVVKKIGFALAAILVCLVLWAVMPEANQNRFRTIWDPDAGPQSATQSARGRIAGLKAGYRIFQEFPVTGIGLGNFSSYRKEFVDGSSERAHNLAGQLLGVTGILGTTFFSLMVVNIVLAAIRVKRATRERGDPTSRVLFHMGDGARMMVLLLLFQGLFSHNMLRFNWLLAGAMATMALAFVRVEDMRYRENIRSHAGKWGRE